MKRKLSIIYLAVAIWAALAALCSSESIALWTLAVANMAFAAMIFRKFDR